MESRNQVLAVEILKQIRARGFEAYFAGGCVRDLILGTEPQDYDIATSALPDDIERMFSRSIPVGKQFGVVIVVMEEHQFEVATFRTDIAYEDGRRPNAVRFVSPEEDAQRRDFTVNGLFYDPVKSEVIDYVGGRRDIEQKLVRAIGDPAKRFEEDHLRILRAVRFAANLDFEIDPDTWKAVCEHRKQIHKVSQERIRAELVKMLTRTGAGRGLQLLSDSGLLVEILPEIEAMKGLKQPPRFHPEGDVFQHTKIMMDLLRAPSMVLAFSALLHDVGKTRTFSEKDGAIHFYNHAPVGAGMAREILTRLKFSGREIDSICRAIENHMRFGDVMEMRLGKLKQLISADSFDDELELHRIDCLASHLSLDNYHFLLRKREEFQQEEMKPKPLINGYDLIALGLKPGPQMKLILNEAYLLQLESKLTEKQQALEFVAKKYMNKEEADL